MLNQRQGLATAFFYRDSKQPRSLPFTARSPADSAALTEPVDAAKVAS